MKTQEYFRFKTIRNDVYEVRNLNLFALIDGREISCGKVSEKEIETLKLIYGKGVKE